MIKPRIKHSTITTLIFLVLVSFVPIRSPIGVIAISAPSVKNIIPMIRRTAPTTKVIRTLFGMGAMLKHNTSTMPMIGNTAPNDSFSFSSKFF